MKGQYPVPWIDVVNIPKSKTSKYLLFIAAIILVIGLIIIYISIQNIFNLLETGFYIAMTGGFTIIIILVYYYIKALRIYVKNISKGSA